MLLIRLVKNTFTPRIGWLSKISMFLLIFILWTLFDVNVAKFGYETRHKILTNPSEFISFIKQNDLPLKIFASAFIGVVVWGIGLSVKKK